jgi:hypothetical protein
LLLHAPQYASLHHFFQSYPCGPSSSILCADDILSQAENLLADPEKYKHFVNVVEDAHRNELNESKLSQSAKDFFATYL